MKRLKKLTDQDLINGLITRNDEIIKRFYTLFFYSVRHLVTTNNGDIHDAKDIFQDAMLVLFQKVRDEGFQVTCTVKTYIYSVAKHLWLKELKKRGLNSYIFSDQEEYVDMESDVVEIYERNERIFLYKKLFDQLSQNCRRILTMFNEGRSVKEITKIMGFKSEQHTRNRRYRCKLSLINRIKDSFGYKELRYETNKAN